MNNLVWFVLGFLFFAFVLWLVCRTPRNRRSRSDSGWFDGFGDFGGGDGGGD